MASLRQLFRFENALNLLLVCVPIALVLEWTHASPIAIFIVSCLAIVPLAGLMGKATEYLAEQMGEGLGGLLNATFGNAAELIIALMALRAGLHEVVKASLTGSILGNILLVLGLLGATAGVALMSELLVESIEHAAAGLGMTQVFVGVILVAIIGNAAEHSTAVLVARKGKMDLAVNIAIGSSLQIALFVAPVLVFASYLFGQPMDLLFTPFEVLAVAVSVLIVNQIASDGESNWMEGVMLLAVYLILALAFYFLPA